MTRIASYNVTIICMFTQLSVAGSVSNLTNGKDSGHVGLSDGPPRGGGGSDAMCYVQNSLTCYVLCKFLFTLLCEIKIGCYAEV